MLTPTQKIVYKKASVEHLLVSLTEVWKECPELLHRGQYQISHSNPGLDTDGLWYICSRLSSPVGS